MDPIPPDSGRRKAARLVAETRRRSGLTQTELSRLAGVPLRTLTRIEAGDVVPRLDSLERLLLGCGRTLATEPRPEPQEETEEAASAPNQAPNVATALAFLRGGFVAHVLVGELAARCHGARVDVSGVDILVPDTRKHRERLLRVVENLDRPFSRASLRVDALQGDRFDGIWRAATPAGPYWTRVASLDELIELEHDEARRHQLRVLREVADRGG